MPVYKYTTFEEAEHALWTIHPDDAYFERVRALWKFADQLCPIRYPRGIFKFKTIEEANAHREAVELAYAKERYQENFINPHVTAGKIRETR